MQKGHVVNDATLCIFQLSWHLTLPRNCLIHCPWGVQIPVREQQWKYPPFWIVSEWLGLGHKSSCRHVRSSLYRTRGILSEDVELYMLLNSHAQRGLNNCWSVEDQMLGTHVFRILYIFPIAFSRSPAIRKDVLVNGLVPLTGEKSEADVLEMPQCGILGGPDHDFQILWCTQKNGGASVQAVHWSLLTPTSLRREEKHRSTATRPAHYETWQCSVRGTCTIGVREKNAGNVHSWWNAPCFSLAVTVDYALWGLNYVMCIKFCTSQMTVFP